MSPRFASTLHDSDDTAAFRFELERASPLQSLIQMMDAASEVMPPLPWPNKGFRWGLSHRDGCRGCREAREASSQQPDAPQSLLRTFQPSTSRCHEGTQMMRWGGGVQDFEGS